MWKLEKITMNNEIPVTFLVHGTEEADYGENVYALIDWQGTFPEDLEEAMEYDWYPLEYVIDPEDTYYITPPAIAAGEIDFTAE